MTYHIRKSHSSARLKAGASFRILLLSLISLLVFPASASGADNGGDGQPELLPTFIPTILEIEDEDEIADIEASGTRILYRRGDLLLALVPVEQASAEQRLRAPGGRRTAPFRPITPALDVARKCFGADRILDGTGLLQTYDGSGVVVGLCDIGFDAAHPAWRDAGGNLRVGLVTQYVEDFGVRRRFETPESILEWRTDTLANDHGSHVAGILSASPLDGVPYVGMAPGAEICFSGSRLYDVGLLAGVEDIVAHARVEGKPVVVNLSMGSGLGPHDGSSLFNRYISRIGEEAIIVLSSGNAGNSDNSMSFTHTARRPEFGFRIANYAWDNLHMNGATEIWSDTSDPVEYRLSAYDSNNNRIDGYLTDWIDASTAETFFDSSENPLFARYFDGYLDVQSGIYRHNGRFYIQFAYDFKADERQPNGFWARYTLAVEVRGGEGVRTRVFADGSRTFLKQFRGPATDTEMSVSDLVCGDNVISVGMYNSRVTYPLLGSGTSVADQNLGEVNVNSGYGVLLDGRVLPHTVAPGCVVISAYNGAALEAHPEDMADASAVFETPYGTAWYGPNSGTSMSSPYVAGSIATWLQANPSLTVDDVKAIIARTNREPSAAADDPRNGQGWFDPYAGLLEAIALSSVADNVTLSEALPQLTLSPEGLRLWTPEADILCLFDTTGKQLASIPVSAGHTTLPFADLVEAAVPGAEAKGILIARLGTAALKFTR